LSGSRKIDDLESKIGLKMQPASSTTFVWGTSPDSAVKRYKKKLYSKKELLVASYLTFAQTRGYGSVFGLLSHNYPYIKPYRRVPHYLFFGLFNRVDYIAPK
jgi:hypothetical protein